MYPISEIDKTTFVFAASVKRIMPRYEDIPANFKSTSNKWNQLFKKLFFKGLKNIRLTPKQGVDTNKAVRHIEVIMRSYEPSYEHKEAAIAFLFNGWFEDFEITDKSESEGPSNP